MQKVTIFNTNDFTKFLTVDNFKESFLIFYGEDELNNLCEMPAKNFMQLFDTWKSCVMKSIFDDFILKLDVSPHVSVFATLVSNSHLLIGTKFSNLKTCVKSIFNDADTFKIEVGDDDKIYITYTIKDTSATLYINRASAFSLKPYKLASVEFCK